MHEVLVNRLGGLSLPRKSVVRLTDRPNMNLAVYNNTTTKHIRVSFEVLTETGRRVVVKTYGYTNECISSKMTNAKSFLPMISQEIKEKRKTQEGYAI